MPVIMPAGLARTLTTAGKRHVQVITANRRKLLDVIGSGLVICHGQFAKAINGNAGGVGIT